jgi:hypothetical protein
MHILCKLGKHKHVERHRKELHRETWHKTNTRTGEKVPNSEFLKITCIVIEECERDDCEDQIAFKEKLVRGNDEDGKIESRTPIHPDLAKEEMFVDKV